MSEKKRRLLWRIFPSFFIITVVSLAAVTYYSTGFFKRYFLAGSEDQLTTQAQLIRREISGKTPDRINDICLAIGRTTGTRVTVILSSGRVIGDSLGDVQEMENHRIRPEIVSALRADKGVSVRYSDTLNQNMMYVALPLETDGAVTTVVRTALSVSAMDVEIKRVQTNLMIALMLTVLAAAGASLFVSRRITRPLEQMKAGAGGLARGDLTLRLAMPDTEELSELALTINHMAERLDEKIKSAEDRTMELEAVLSSMGEGVIAVDLNERVLMVNRAVAGIFDHPIETMTNKNILEIARNYDLHKFIKRALASPDSIGENITLTDTGKRLFNVHSNTLSNAQGERMGTLIIFHDITRMHRLETMHKDFAANVSHELKTPLTSIKGFIETLQDLDESEALTRREGFLTIIEKNVNRMIALVDDLMALSKLERQEGDKTVFEPHDLSAVIKSARAACRTRSESGRVTVKADLSGPLFIPMDTLLVEQALVNLLDNALKYSEPGGEVLIQVAQEKGSALIRVIDSGPGIGQEHLSRIFERFYRVDSARSTDMGGTGLGLAIVKHIVQYHNGTIRVESTPDKGAMFEISLPLA
ncbi:two-component hybrid sensor and response regulator histidine kinase (phoR-like protein) [Desulforapulum autotrophicum HRM2]|uniref:histidine kinase n=1 Tax=Desulforapulum autotrophicum (strain ATCC 43914 / DSM 3382 / VKM B-1955 / HRM2) TaxID=177437 RepID=C0QFG7_DESAH|nr:ATP-binding protein [Desulforapulum autotrophicum]ACN13363.1 two-component hybrid sensor and response regulator histidine kinase (phoR-like protein) [Desulforapulum autotrophicum HRM2]